MLDEAALPLPASQQAEIRPAQSLPVLEQPPEQHRALVRIHSEGYVMPGTRQPAVNGDSSQMKRLSWLSLSVPFAQVGCKHRHALEVSCLYLLLVLLSICSCVVKKSSRGGESLTASIWPCVPM